MAVLLLPKPIGAIFEVDWTQRFQLEKATIPGRRCPQDQGERYDQQGGTHRKLQTASATMEGLGDGEDLRTTGEEKLATLHTIELVRGTGA